MISKSDIRQDTTIYCLWRWRVLTGCNDNDDDRDLLRSYLLIKTSMVSLNDAEVYVKLHSEYTTSALSNSHK